MSAKQRSRFVLKVVTAARNTKMAKVLKSLILLSIISGALSAVAGAAGGESLTFAEIAHLVAANVDEDHDGNLTVTEIYDSIVLRFDHDGNGCAGKQEFVKQWSHDYHDNPHISAIFFDHLDLDQDGCLTKSDIAFNFRAMDSAHGDHSVTETEFADFLRAVHPNRQGGGGQDVVG
ncbi:uncharacterized protein LOC125656925 isoform X2 [Ostrea edulis]|uniref:uncharacterized protein LOC125656925 isoform X2 n=1 Tax=Ostrea edulis TaxID=37623 RepID=UPI0024AF97AB|nr:uncharacterized protein LOC125656925 isoform X2 [Ostrea edulis]